MNVYIIKTEDGMDIFYAPTRESFVYDALSEDDVGDLNSFIMDDSKFTILEHKVENVGRLFVIAKDGGEWEKPKIYNPERWKDITARIAPLIKTAARRTRFTAESKDLIRPSQIKTKAAAGAFVPGGKIEKALTSWDKYCRSQKFEEQPKKELLEDAKLLEIDIPTSATKKEICAAIREYIDSYKGEYYPAFKPAQKYMETDWVLETDDGRVFHGNKKYVEMQQDNFGGRIHQEKKARPKGDAGRRGSKRKEVSR